jgi:hypothetical protein
MRVLKRMSCDERKDSKPLAMWPRWRRALVHSSTNDRSGVTKIPGFASTNSSCSRFRYKPLEGGDRNATSPKGGSTAVNDQGRP